MRALIRTFPRFHLNTPRSSRRPSPAKSRLGDTPVIIPSMKAVLLHSGGLDSSVLLYHLRDQGHDVAALSVRYGQRHHREIDAAAAICVRAGVEHRVADLAGLRELLVGSALTDDAVAMPTGGYGIDNMKQTVVPNRNMVLLSVAGAWAVSLKADAVAYAAHGGDHEIYPDCRPAFADAMATALSLCDWHAPQLLRPFVDMTKADIVRRGDELNVPFELTWSCYQGGDQHCGDCPTCRERKKAFAEADVDDPTIYDPTV